MESYQKQTRLLQQEYGKLTQVNVFNDEIKEKQT